MDLMAARGAGGACCLGGIRDLRMEEGDAYSIEVRGRDGRRRLIWLIRDHCLAEYTEQRHPICNRCLGEDCIQSVQYVTAA
jgi:hypothetical protein